jgi:hypothetical protein
MSSSSSGGGGGGISSSSAGGGTIVIDGVDVSWPEWARSRLCVGLSTVELSALVSEDDIDVSETD